MHKRCSPPPTNTDWSAWKDAHLAFQVAGSVPQSLWARHHLHTTQHHPLLQKKGSKDLTFLLVCWHINLQLKFTSTLWLKKTQGHFSTTKSKEICPVMFMTSIFLKIWSKFIKYRPWRNKEHRGRPKNQCYPRCFFSQNNSFEWCKVWWK